MRSTRPASPAIEDARVVITIQNQGRGEIVLREPRPGEGPQ